ncbi:hypothetical protein D3C86_1428030 [compost metagenome]
MSWARTITAWVFGTSESGRVLPVVGSVTSVWFQVLRALIRPPLKPNRSSGAWIFTDSRSSVASPMLPVADRPSSSGMTSMASLISS